jgi:hypothetical protein
MKPAKVTYTNLQKAREAKALKRDFNLFKQKYDFRGYTDKEILEAYMLVKADQVSIKRKQEKQSGIKKKKKEAFYADSDEEFDDMSEDEIIEVQKTQTKKPQVVLNAAKGSKKRALKNTEFESKLWSDYRALQTEKARKAAREQLANLKRQQAAPKPPPPKPKPAPPKPNVAQKRSAPTKNVSAKKPTPKPQTDSESELDFESSDEDMEDLVFPQDIEVEKALKNVDLKNLTAAQVKKLAPFGAILDKLSPDQLQELLESNSTTHGDDRPILVTGQRRVPKGTKPRKRAVLLPNGKYIQI